jgi:hypothetical protein
MVHWLFWFKAIALPANALQLITWTDLLPPGEIAKQILVYPFVLAIVVHVSKSVDILGRTVYHVIEPNKFSPDAYIMI